MIPAEAVEAAARATADLKGCPKEWQFYLSEAKAALEAAAPYMQEPAAVDEFTPTRWWRALGLVGGNVLAETSNPRDFKSLGLSESGAIFQRMYETRSSKWVDEKP